MLGHSFPAIPRASAPCYQAAPSMIRQSNAAQRNLCSYFYSKSNKKGNCIWWVPRSEIDHEDFPPLPVLFLDKQIDLFPACILIPSNCHTPWVVVIFLDKTRGRKGITSKAASIMETRPRRSRWLLSTDNMGQKVIYKIIITSHSELTLQNQRQVSRNVDPKSIHQIARVTWENDGAVSQIACSAG